MNAYATEPEGLFCLTVPLPAAACRGAEPALALNYQSDGGPGPFGYGFSLTIPSISRQITKQLPRYDTSDVFVYSDELVPVDKSRREFDGACYDVVRMQPRVEKSFERIEFFTASDGSASFWRVLDATGKAYFYGRTAQARVADPVDPRRVFEWLLEEVSDPKGERCCYAYKADGAARLLTSVSYGNATPYLKDWCFEVVFNYGEREECYVPVREWTERPDPRRSYHAGFEIPMRRRCNAVMLFHHFEALGPEPFLARLTRLVFDADSRLRRVEEIAFAASSRQAMPPLDLNYRDFTPENTTQELHPSRPGATLLDFKGEGIPGMFLDLRAESPWFWPAQADGGYGPAERPGHWPLGGGFLLDVTGDGYLDVLRDERPTGFFPGGHTEAFTQFKPFDAFPLDFFAKGSQLVDLGGTGRQDLVMIGTTTVDVYPSLGAKGYGPRISFPCPAGLPPTTPTDLAYHNFCAFFGTGGHHRLRITRNSIEVWPDLGFGRFADKLDILPAPDLGADFAPARLRLFNIDGSGAPALAYVCGNAVSIYLNRGGAIAVEPIRIKLPAPCFDISQVSIADIGGRGYDCLLFSEAGTGRSWTWDFCGRSRPYLLEGVDDNRGMQLRIRYAPSTRWYLLDAEGKKPWSRSLPFPVTAVAAIERRDHISGQCSVSTFSYSHGWYDAIERAFRGFGRIDRTDSDSGFDNPVSTPNGTLTRTWYHSGSAGDLKRLSSEFFAGDPLAWPAPGESICPDVVLDVETARQANVALRGLKLREEVHGPDSAAPFGAVDFSHSVRLERARDGEGHAIFAVHERERIEYDYECVATDPRISHVLVLAVDERSEVTCTCQLFYPRRPGVPDTLPEQLATKLVTTRNVYAPPINDPDALLFGLLIEAKSCEVTPPPLSMAGRITPETLASYLAGITDECILRWEKISHYSGQQGLIRERCSAEFSAERAMDLYGKLVLGMPLDNYLSTRGGYTFDADWWWAPSDVTIYDADKFYLPTANINPLGQQTLFCYDAYGLLLLSITERGPGCAELVEYAEGFDYELLRASRQIDANGVIRESYADAFGRPYVSTQYKFGELAGFAPLSQWRAVGTTTFETVVANPAHFLQNAMAFSYREDLAWCGAVEQSAFTEPGLWDDLMLHGWINREGILLSAFHALKTAEELFLSASFSELRESAYIRLCKVPCRQPVRESTLQAQSPTTTVPATPTATQVQIRVHHLDGFQRPVQVSTLVEPGKVMHFEENDVVSERWAETRWRATGAVVYDYNSELVRQYQPCFVPAPVFIERRLLPSLNPEVTIQRDPIGHAVRIEHPRDPLIPHEPILKCGVFESITYSAWRVERRDANETIKAAPLYSLWVEKLPPPGLDPFEIDALHKAAAVSGGATIEHFDNLGHIVQVSVAGLITHFGLDISGRELWGADPRLAVLGRRNIERSYALSGQVLMTRSVDAGTSLSLQDIKGRSILLQDARSFLFMPDYDGLGRPASLRVSGGDGPHSLNHIIERWVYADQLDDDDSVPVKDPESQNMRGRLFRHYDSSGLYEVTGYDLAGRPTHTVRRLRADYIDEADWHAEGPWTTTFDSLCKMLEPESFRTELCYDALGRLSNWTDVSGQTHRRSYTLGGGVKQEILAGEVYRELLCYDINGQPEDIVFGNGHHLVAEYAPDTGKLRRMRYADQYEASYYYDPDGGVTHIHIDNGSAQGTDLDYSYDAHRRLVLARGRARTEIDSEEDRSAALSPLLPPRASETYEQYYKYDNSGNLAELTHNTSSVLWSRRFEISASSNRAIEAGFPSAFDAGGNLLALDAATSLAWNCWNNLRCVERSGDKEYYVYDSDGRRTRKVRHLAAEHMIEDTIYLEDVEYFIRRKSSQAHERRWRVASAAGDVQFVSWQLPERPAQQRYQVLDMLGSHAIETDEAGVTLTSEEFFPYGATALAEGQPPQIQLKVIRHAGRERDQFSGLYYYGHRYYAPALGRWVSPDPSGDSDGLNLYAFVHGDPVNSTDLSGLGTQAKRKRIDWRAIVAPRTVSRRSAADKAEQTNRVMFSAGSGKPKNLLMARATEPIDGKPTAPINAAFIENAIKNKSYKQLNSTPLTRIQWKGAAVKAGTPGIPVYLTSRFGSKWSASHTQRAQELGESLKEQGFTGLRHGKSGIHYAENSHLIAGSLYGCNDELSAPSASVHQNTEWLAIEEGLKKINDDSVRLKTTGYERDGILHYARYKIYIGGKKVFDHLSYGLRGDIDKNEARELKERVKKLNAKSPAVSLHEGPSKGLHGKSISEKMMAKGQAGGSEHHPAFTGIMVINKGKKKLYKGMQAREKHQDYLKTKAKIKIGKKLVDKWIKSYMDRQKAARL